MKAAGILAVSLGDFVHDATFVKHPRTRMYELWQDLEAGVIPVGDDEDDEPDCGLL